MTASSGRARVCVVGSSNLDLVATTTRLPLPGETVLGHTYHEHPGGKGLNQAIAVARAGGSCVFVSAVGNDSAGKLLTDVMRSDGLDIDGVIEVSGVATGRALIGVADSGENSIIVVPGANMHVQVDDVPDVDVVLAQLEVPLDTVFSTFRQARSRGITTVLNPAPAQDLPAALLALCDVVIPNEHELDVLGGVDALIDHGVRTVVVTLGARGAEVHDAAGRRHVEPFTVSTVDTTGAGDTFCGSLSACLAAGEQLDDALRYAAAAAALSTTRAGAVSSIPMRSETEHLMRSVSS